MSFMELFRAPSLWVEIRPESIHLHNGAAGEDLPAAWEAAGTPDAATRDRLLGALARLAPRKPWQARGTLWCALPARGVSLRPVSVPATTQTDVRKFLALQIEARFPVPPDQLAWGWSEPSSGAAARPDGLREFTVAAIRREPVERLAELFAAAGFNAIFGVAATLRCRPLPENAGDACSLDLGTRSTECLEYGNGVPTTLRSLPWGLGDLVDAVAAELAADRNEAAAALAALARGDAMPPSRRAAIAGTVERAVAVLADGVRRPAGAPGFSRILVTGISPEARLVADALAAVLRPLAVDGPPQGTLRPGLTPAVAGLRSATTGAGSRLPIRLAVAPPPATADGGGGGVPSIPWKWVVRGGVLVAALVLFPYAEAFVGRPILTRRLAALRKDTARLGEIDRRLEFLQYVTDNQSPYIDAVYVVANAAPPGARIESLSMNRRGEVSIGGYTQMPQQVVDFRNKLVDSGFFSGVVLEEQTPIVGGQPRVNLRLTAQWKGPAARESLKLGPVLPDPPKTNAPATNNAVPPTRPAATNGPAQS